MKQDRLNYTTGANSIQDNQNIQPGLSSNSNINWDNYINMPIVCQYLLPCGLCSRTMSQCPKFLSQDWKPTWIWSPDSAPTWTTSDTIKNKK